MIGFTKKRVFSLGLLWQRRCISRQTYSLCAAIKYGCHYLGRMGEMTMFGEVASITTAHQEADHDLRSTALAQTSLGLLRTWSIRINHGHPWPLPTSLNHLLRYALPHFMNSNLHSKTSLDRCAKNVIQRLQDSATAQIINREYSTCHGEHLQRYAINQSLYPFFTSTPFLLLTAGVARLATSTPCCFQISN